MTTSDNGDRNSGAIGIPRIKVESPTVAISSEQYNSFVICWYVAVYIAESHALSNQQIFRLWASACRETYTDAEPKDMMTMIIHFLVVGKFLGFSRSSLPPNRTSNSSFSLAARGSSTFWSRIDVP